MNFLAISSEIATTILAMVILGIDLLMPKEKSRKCLGYITVIGLVGVFIAIFNQYHLGNAPTFVQNLFIMDNLALLIKQMCLLAVGFTVLFSVDFVEKLPKHHGEFYVLILSALIGMMVMASANDFLTLFVGLELMAISFYVLVGYALKSSNSSEAGVKYLIIGSTSSAIMLYGVSLVYGTTGSIIFQELAANFALYSTAALVGILMVLIGFFFKMSIIPFHMWAPDIYQGAPTPITALLATASKTAAVAALIRVLFMAFAIVKIYWLPVLVLLSTLSMIGGNLMALRQTNVKRLLAYSSIAQAGYMLIGIIAADAAGIKGVLFYTLIYIIANIGAFSVLIAVDKNYGEAEFSTIAGLGQRAPLLAAVLTISLLSMAGIPPMAGFVGKLYLFTAVVEKGHLLLAFIGFIMSMISVYYYLQVAKTMYIDKPASSEKIELTFAIRVTVLLSLIGTVVLGIYPEPISNFINMVISTL